MGLRNFLRVSTPVTDAAVEGLPAFSVTPDDVPAEVFGFESYDSPTAPAPRIDRKSAIQVPAVKRCRDLIATTLGSLPVDLIGADKQAISPAPLFEQPEKDVPRSVTMTRTFEDMLFEKVAWWLITEKDWRGFPAKVRRLDPRSVTVREDGKVFITRSGNQGMASEWVPDDQLIRFDSPNDGLLIAGARAIRTCLRLDAATANYAEGTPPMEYFTPADGVDPEDDEEIINILNAWKSARQARSTAYVPASLQYNVNGWNPEQLQLADARQHAVLEIARIAGVDAEDLGVSTTSRTYFNAFQQRKDFLDFTLGGYVAAFQDRLSMNDVCPRGYYARFNLDAFMRSDTMTRYQTYEVGLRVGAIDKDEVRDLEDKPPLEGAPAPNNIRALPAPEAVNE